MNIVAAEYESSSTRSSNNVIFLKYIIISIKSNSRSNEMSKVAGKFGGALKKQVAAPTKNVFDTIICAQCASAGPPLGPLLGQYGLNIGNFCKEFNEKTKIYKKGIPFPTTVKIRPDRSFEILLHTPPESYYLKQAAGIEQAKIEGDTTAAGKVTLKHVYEIAKIKYEDPLSKYQILDFNEVVKQIIGHAYLNGIDVVRDLDPEEYQQFLTERFAYLKEVAERLEEEAKIKLQRLS